MDHVSLKSVIRKKFKEMVVLGLGFTVAVGFFPVTSWADFQNSTKQTCGFNNQSLDGYLTEVSAGERIIMARGGNRSGSGGAMGQKRSGDSKNKCRYGTGDGAKTDGGGK